MSDHQNIKEDLSEMRAAMKELAENMNKLTAMTIRFEERAIADRDRMDRIEQNQKDQGMRVATLHDAVIINTQAVKRIAWVSTVACGSFITGSTGLIFWLIKELMSKSIS
jgi:excinuclease UvrABC nuclease subunit